MGAPKRPSLDQIRVPSRVSTAATARQRIIEHSGGLYLNVMPIEWLLEAASCGARAVRAGVVLWWVSGMTRYQMEHIEVRGAHLKKCGVLPRDYRKGLELLERAGLAKVDRRSGHRSLVTILW
jgi:hypothetical protein